MTTGHAAESNEILHEPSALDFLRVFSHECALCEELSLLTDCDRTHYYLRTPRLPVHVEAAHKAIGSFNIHPLAQPPGFHLELARR